MKRSTKLSPKTSRIIPVVLLIACLAPAAAPACQKSYCAIVPIPGNPFCRQCILDTGEATAACRSNGPCGCIYFQCAAATVKPPAVTADWRSFVVGGEAAPGDAIASPASLFEVSLLGL